MSLPAFADPPPRLLDRLSAPALGAPESGIVEVMNHGRLRPGLVPFWAGEGDLPTPDFITAAAKRSLDAGETFYTWQGGIPELRDALARYHRRRYGAAFGFCPERFFVTGSGMQAIQIAIRMVAEAGDEIVVPTPGWPNFAAAVGVAGARPVAAPLDFSQAGWTLDIARIAAAIGPRTRAIVVNSPANPTGWTASLADLAALLDLARQRDLWIVADEVYGRFFYEGGQAPSFHDIAGPEDRILYANTFSKNWAMTGWRIGWLETPAALGPVVENLIQYSTSGLPTFAQRAAVAALDEGEDFVQAQIARSRLGRDIVVAALSATGRVRLAPPPGAFYLFFGIEGMRDTRRLGLRLVDEANVGLAPGTAFGPEGEGFLRLCFARSEGQLRTGAERLADWIMARDRG